MAKQLKVNMTMGILHTIAKSIYSSTEGKIREAVANSMDNNASAITVYADRTTATVSIFDNGKGITEKHFEEIFTHLGYGLDKDKPLSLSYFGLGLMSIIKLGKKANIITKSSESPDILLLSIDVTKIFDKKNEDQPIAFLKNCIRLREAKLLDRVAKSPLSDEYIKNILGGTPNTFTEIIIEGVNTEDLERISEEDFKDELRKILPLRREKDDPFLSRITDPNLKKDIINILDDETYCPSINIYFGIAGEKELAQIWKYFPEFKRELEFGEANILTGKNDGFAYYFLTATEDLERREKENAETGFWVRNRNFLVKSADFFQQPGKRKKMIHDPLKNWIYGEIFHKNMNDFLVVSRNDYSWNSEEFKKFEKEVYKIVEHLNTELRAAWKSGDLIVKNLIWPFKEIGQPKGPFKRINETLSKMGVSCDGEDALRVLDELSEKRNHDIEEAPSIEDLFKKGSGRIVLHDSDTALVTIDKKIYRDDFTKTWDQKNERIIVSISHTLFSSKEVVFLGKGFNVVFVAGKEVDSGISIDPEAHKIYVNPFNHDLMSYSISFLDVYIAIELADLKSATKEEMKEYLLKILGREYTDVSDYLGPLADDLQRKRGNQ